MVWAQCTNRVCRTCIPGDGTLVLPLIDTDAISSTIPPAFKLGRLVFNSSCLDFFFLCPSTGFYLSVQISRDWGTKDELVILLFYADPLHFMLSMTTCSATRSYDDDGDGYDVMQRAHIDLLC